MEIRKNKKLKKIARLAIIITAVILLTGSLFFSLLRHKPSYYKPLDLTGSKEESVYLTNELGPELYNGAQRQEPFNLVVTQRGINDIVARLEWPKEFGSIRFSAPMVLFVPDSIVLMGTVLLNGAEFVGTVVAEPTLDAEGLLNLQVVSVKLGAVDITPLAGVLARRIYQQPVVSGPVLSGVERVEPRFAAADTNAEDFWARATASLLNGEPFNPVFKIEDKKVRVEKITIEQKKLTVRLVPVLD